MEHLTLLLFLSLATTLSVAQYYGDLCSLNDTKQSGICLSMEECEDAQGEGAFSKSQNLQYCHNDGFPTFILCCPLPNSEIKCLTYNEQRAQGLSVAGGIKTKPKEFPHMAAIGYGDKNNIQWLCGGSLISDQFVLTAAHCLSSRQVGNARWVRLGDLDLQNSTDLANPENFSINQTFPHPNYKKSSHYHDIALLKLDRCVKFNKFVKPACLQRTISHIPDNLIVTGWGKIDLLGDSSSHLLKATLRKVDRKVCNEAFVSVSRKKLAEGIVDDSQICAGHPEGKDTCPGDSGGPLQYVQEANPDFYRIVGVTSFGKGCGFQNSVGVYTRVSYYVRWIEDIVWPTQKI